MACASACSNNFSTGKPANLAPILQRIGPLSRGSIADEATTHTAMAGCEVVFHLAALPSVAQARRPPDVAPHLRTRHTAGCSTAPGVRGCGAVGLCRQQQRLRRSARRCRSEEDRSAALALRRRQAGGRASTAGFTAGVRPGNGPLRFFNVFGPRQDAGSPYSGVIALFTRR